jgi:hypothetical protein
MTFAIETKDTSIVAYGVSDQLKAEFDLLREVNCTAGKMKFSSSSVDLLAQHIVCRHYSKICYEFAHLNWALIYANTNTASSIQNTFVNYYWLEQCHWPQYFKQYFSNLCEPIETAKNQNIGLYTNQNLHADTSIKSEGITLKIYDHVFSISASRANILACFMEWLIGVVPDVLNTLETCLHGKGHNGIREFSSWLQKHIYEYLSEHLPPAKLQQRFRLIQSWYSESAREAMTDDSLFDFWQQHNNIEGYGKYSNVVKDSLSYLSALSILETSLNVQHASNALDNTEHLSAQSIDNLHAKDEAHHFNSVGQYKAQTVLPISNLLSAPKALNKQQFELFELFSQYPQHLMPLSSTWLRLQVFGKVQHQIIQMNRVKNPLASDSDHYAGLYGTGYQQVSNDCVRLMASNQQCLLAISQLMLSFSPNQACLILLKLLPQMPSFENFTSEFSSLLEDAVSTGKSIDKPLVLQWRLTYPWLNKLFKQSELALKQINRQGFTATTLLPSEDYLRCAELLFDLNKLIKQAVNRINQQNQDSQEKFEADRLIFHSEFVNLYSNNLTTLKKEKN